MKKNAKGLIALDIDGTITVDMKDISTDVVDYLTHLNNLGWAFVFITGRTFDFGYQVLSILPFEYYYAVQNGAILLSMPDRKIISKKYLHKSIIPQMENICEGYSTDFVVYAGLEWNNQCFYRKNYFSDQILEYLEARQKAFRETWKNLSSFDLLPLDEFPSIKCFGELKSAEEIAFKIETYLGLHVPLIKDPFNQDYYVAQATHPDVSKGQVLKDLVQQTGFKGSIIAAGDDLNDLTMFDAANIKIAMENAPMELKLKANIIAPPASLAGIIEGLKVATQSIDKKK